mgnify:CR=1 FL=1
MSIAENIAAVRSRIAAAAASASFLCEHLPIRNIKSTSAHICAAKLTAVKSPSCAKEKPYSPAKGTKSSAVTLVMTA